MGTDFFDYDHDGWDGLLIVNGHAIRFPTMADRSQKPILIRNELGKFNLNAIKGGEYFITPHNPQVLPSAILTATANAVLSSAT